MPTAPTYNRVSPGVYRSSTGQLVTQNKIPKPTTTATTPQAPTYSTSFRQAGNNYYRGGNGKLIAGSAIDQYGKKFNADATKFAGMKREDAGYNDLANRLKTVGSRYGFDYGKVLGKDWTPYAAQVEATAPTVETAPVAEAPAAPPAAPPVVGSQYANYESPMTAALMKAFGQGVNTMQAYEPKNFEGSPMYQFQKQKGSQDLEKLMAARGLTGSGAEVQANSDFLVNLNAQESEKQRQYADQTAQRQQQAMQFIANFDQSEKEALRNQWNTDLDRQQNISQFEANRGDSKQALAANFLTNILQMQAQNNVGNNALSGLNQQTALTDALQKMMGQFTANNYARSYGGGGGTPPVAPTGNDSAMMKTLIDYGNRAGNNDFLNGLFSIFGGSK